jgi:choline dehydrogenase-like flavoprotein
MDEADYLIVGGGSAGAVVASRLSENPSCRVLLIEAGQDTAPGAVPADIADAFPSSYANRSYSWPGLTVRGVVGGEPRPFTQARVMGGGSSLMGMWALRGLPGDYDGWAAAGANGWAWDDVLPYFCRLERDLDHGGNAHGADGPVPIRRIARERWPQLAQLVERAAAAQGHAFRPDINAGDEDDGFFPIPFSQDDGVRASSAHCYLTPAVRARRNLTVMPHTAARRIAIEGARACGVLVERDGEERLLRARQVILCAGAIHSPALLMRSGIGPAAALQALGIAPVADLAGVGQNLQNHVFIHIGLTVARAARQAETLRNYGIGALRLSSGHADGQPGDLLVSVIGRVGVGLIGTRAALMTAKLYAPKSRGAVALASADPAAPPAVDFRLLDHEADLARMVQAANMAGLLLCDPHVASACPEAFILPPEPPLQKLNRSGAAGALLPWFAAGVLEAPSALRRTILARIVGAERMLDRAKAPEPFAADLVRRSATPMFHVAGTCAMGAGDDPQAVVDSACRVRGVQGLRVIDASIMPVVPRANTNIPTIMLAERAVDLVRAVPA